MSVEFEEVHTSHIRRDYKAVIAQTPLFGYRVHLICSDLVKLDSVPEEFEHFVGKEGDTRTGTYCIREAWCPTRFLAQFMARFMLMRCRRFDGDSEGYREEIL